MGWWSGRGQGRGPSPWTHGSHSFTLGRAGEKEQMGPGCSPAVSSRERLHSLLNLVLFLFFHLPWAITVPAQHLDKSAPQPC